jgi:hypothetical protein
MDFLNWLINHSLVAAYDVLDYYEIDDATFLKLKIVPYFDTKFLEYSV